MSHRLTCTSCELPIPNGQAKITTRLFEQRAWHPACWAATHAPAVPEQRTAAHDTLVSTRVA